MTTDSPLLLPTYDSPGGAPSPPLTLRRIGWAAYEITTAQGTRIVVDPYLHGSEGEHSGLPESPFSVDDLADADVVAVTHAGFDHRAQAIDVALAGSAILLCGTALYGVAVESGLPAERCAGIVSGCTFRHADVTIKALDARHTSNMTWHGKANERMTRTGATKRPICALEPIAMFTARSILSFTATTTAT